MDNVQWTLGPADDFYQIFLTIWNWWIINDAILDPFETMLYHDFELISKSVPHVWNYNCRYLFQNTLIFRLYIVYYTEREKERGRERERVRYYSELFCTLVNHCDTSNSIRTFIKISLKHWNIQQLVNSQSNTRI